MRILLFGVEIASKFGMRSLRALVNGNLVIRFKPYLPNCLMKWGPVCCQRKPQSSHSHILNTHQCNNYADYADIGIGFVCNQTHLFAFLGSLLPTHSFCISYKKEQLDKLQLIPLFSLSFLSITVFKTGKTLLGTYVYFDHSPRDYPWWKLLQPRKSLALIIIERLR